MTQTIKAKIESVLLKNDTVSLNDAFEKYKDIRAHKEDIFGASGANHFRLYFETWAKVKFGEAEYNGYWFDERAFVETVIKRNNGAILKLLFKFDQQQQYPAFLVFRCEIVYDGERCFKWEAFKTNPDDNWFYTEFRREYYRARDQFENVIMKHRANLLLGDRKIIRDKARTAQEQFKAIHDSMKNIGII